MPNNSTIYYYDNYYIYFKSLWQNDKNDRTIIESILYVILIIIKIILTFFVKLYSTLIIKNLSPEYLICSNSLFYFITELIDSIACLFLHKFKYYKLFDILDELFSILGTIFYLELIEFHFWGLDFNLKINIIMRSIKEMEQSKITDLLEDDI